MATSRSHPSRQPGSTQSDIGELFGLEVGLSPSTENILTLAYEEAKVRNHEYIGTEHVLWALTQVKNRAIKWLEYTVHKDARQVILKDLLSRKLFQPKETASSQLNISSSLIRALKHTAQISSGQVHDGKILYKCGLVASEFLLAGILVEGTGLAMLVLDRIGKIPTPLYLSSIGRKMSDFDFPSTKWHEHIISPIPDSLESWIPGKDLPDVNKLSESPTFTSNWLIPGKLIVGERPYEKDDIANLASAGVNTFVNLRAEIRSKQRWKSGYVSTVPNGVCLWFPIPDFDAPERDALSKFTLELDPGMLLSY